jgi:hypothetical protein
VNIFSNGGQPILVNSISITGDFQQFSNCTQFISNSCFITVEFTPTVAGPRSSTLTVNTNLGVFSIPLAGDGAAPLPNLAPATLVFPSQTVGTTSTPQLITLANDGTADLVINSAFGTPDFQVTLATCSGILSPGASCTLSVVFTPTIAAQITGTVEVDTNGGPASITVTGTGTAPIASLSPQTLSFTAQPLNSSSPAQTITVTNISGVLLRLTSLMWFLIRPLPDPTVDF